MEPFPDSRRRHVQEQDDNIPRYLPWDCPLTEMKLFHQLKPMAREVILQEIIKLVTFALGVLWRGFNLPLRPLRCLSRFMV